MLSDQEQSRIKAEEQYRFSVREQLEKNMSDKRKETWRLINSPIIVALLPSIAVVLLPILFINWQESSVHRLEDTKQVRMLDVEISTRVENALYDLSRWRDTFWLASDSYKARIVLDTLDANSVMPSEVLYAYKEFEHLSLKALLSSRKALRPQSSIPDLRSASLTLAQIQKEFATISGDTESGEVNRIVQNAIKQLTDGFSSWIAG